VDEHCSLASVESRPQRLEGRIAEVFFAIVVQENHPVGPQRVERIFDFQKSAIDVGSGTVAKSPKRSGRLATSSADYSLTRRAIFRRSFVSQPTMPGGVSERIPIAISWESIKSIALSGDHRGRTELDASPDRGPEGSPP